MTKYILAGGNDRAYSDFPATLIRELPAGVSDVTLLSCFFSVPKEEWDDKSCTWREWFKNNLGITRYDWADYDNFTDKLQQAGIVYFHGGNTKLLLQTIANYPDLKTLLQNKIVIGSSAGANMLAKNYWSSTFAEHGKGLGFVEANIMVHYGAIELEGGSILRSSADLKEYRSTFQRILGDSEKILPLPEGNVIVFENT